MFSVDNLKFDEKGLIPAVVVDHYTKEVLTLAYMNRESLAITLEKGLTCFYSRSRQKLWLKGETSGNFQHVVSVTADCDGDAPSPTPSNSFPTTLSTSSSRAGKLPPKRVPTPPTSSRRALIRS